MKRDDVTALHFVGARVSNQPSNARPSSPGNNYYGDPSNIDFQLKGDCMQKTKEIEGLLRYELDNWLRWGRRRDWMPTSFRCPMGFAYKTLDRDDVAPPVNVMHCDDIGAASFERIVVALPQQHRQAFVMHHLDKAAVAGFVVIVKGRDDRARILGIQKSRYHEMVNQAHSMVLRECVRINPGMIDDD